MSARLNKRIGTLRSPPSRLRTGWRIGLLLVWLVLFGLLWANTSPPAASQSPPVDPALSVAGSGGMAVPGGEVVYHIRLLNWTENIVPGGIITHSLPSGFIYVPDSAQVTIGGWPITPTHPINQGSTLIWGPFQLPAAGHTAHNPYGVHTFVQDLCLPEFIDLQLDQALELVGSGGYVTQLFYRITPETTGPDPCAVYYLNAAYDHNLVPILRLQGDWNPVGFWEKPDAGPNGDYQEIAAAFARYVAGLPRRDTHPLYITIWNEPDLWVEWSGTPNPQEYGRFFVAVSSAIRDLHDQRIRILNGAMTPANTSFIRQLMGVPGFVHAFDAWASHCYPFNHPPWYNIHMRTARYGNAVIDCYIEERDTIARYGGRTGLKFVITESGHGLGDNNYAFEGFPRINESNRANYMSVAFNTYWQRWPEVIAITPFQLGDPWNGWEWLDWVDYTLSQDSFQFTYVPHLQLKAVTALNKPRGVTMPHGIEVTFRARAAENLTPGTYTSQIFGATAIGATAALTQAAPVQLVSQIHRTYLPFVHATQKGGVWYTQDLSESSIESFAGRAQANPPPEKYPEGDVGNGTIIPTHILTTSKNRSSTIPASGERTTWQIIKTFEGSMPYMLALDRQERRTYIALTGGELALLNLETLEVERSISLGTNVRALAPGQDTDAAYVALDTDEVILVDMVNERVVARANGLGRPWDLVFDPLSGTLLVANSQDGTVVRLSSDLSTCLASHALGDLPDQLLLDPSHRRLYVTLAGARRILALNADTLESISETELAGGPLLTAKLDATRGQLYVLSTLSPRYRGLWVLGTDDLSLLALIAGSPIFPLRQATALALSPRGELLVAEGTALYTISPEDFGVVHRVSLEHPVERGGLIADPLTGRIIRADSGGISVEEK